MAEIINEEATPGGFRDFTPPKALRADRNAKCGAGGSVLGWVWRSGN